MTSRATVSSSHAPRNRITRLRMRDKDRWVHTYRDAAWEAALAESRRRSFFSSLVHAVTMWTTLMLHPHKDT